MKYAIFSFDGYGLAIASRLQAEGCEVVAGMVQDQEDTISTIEKNVPQEDKLDKNRRLSLHEGLVEKCEAKRLIKEIRRSPEEWFVFFDLNHLYRFADELAGLPLAGNFPTEADYLLEIDRDKAKEFVIEHYPDIKVAEKHRFKSAAAAKKFLSKSDELWVLKGLAEDARTILPDVDDVDLAHGQILDALANSPEEYESAGFIFELLIRNALELTPQKIYRDGTPVATCLCVENKQLGAGNVGPMTDCAMDAVFATEMDEKINQIAFPSIVDEMASDRKGLFFWDASLLADPRTGRLYFGEFCSNRPGYNSLFTEMALSGGANKYLSALASGKSPYAEGQIAVSVRLFNLHRDADSRPLGGLTIDYKDRVSDGLWLCDARSVGRRLVSAGYKDTVGVMTASGGSLSEASRKVYRQINEFSFEGAFYRPQFDMVSREYGSSILNRIDFGLQKSLFRIGFGL